MQRVQHAMERRCDQDRDEGYEQKSGVKNKNAREYPCSGGISNAIDIMLSEDEARTMKGFRPTHLIEISRPERAPEEGHADERERCEERARHATYELPAREERLFAMLEHGASKRGNVRESIELWMANCLLRRTSACAPP